MVKKRIIISGSSGVIGLNLLKLILKDDSFHQIICLYNKHVPNINITSNRCQFVQVDLTDSQSITQAMTIIKPYKGLTIGVHCAADVSWHKELKDVTAINIGGSIAFCELLHTLSSQLEIIYISSAYTDIDNWTYRNSYEESKALAEIKIREAFPLTPISTFSCSLAIGSSIDGYISRFHGIYPIIRCAAFYDMPFLVGDIDGKLDLVPANWVANELYLHILQDKASRASFVIAAAGEEQQLSTTDVVKILYQRINQFRTARHFDEIQVPAIIPYRRWTFLRRSIEAWKVNNIPKNELKKLSVVLEKYNSYLEVRKVSAPQNIQKQLPDMRDCFRKAVDFWLSSHEDKLQTKWKNHHNQYA